MLPSSQPIKRKKPKSLLVVNGIHSVRIERGRIKKVSDIARRSSRIRIQDKRKSGNR